MRDFVHVADIARANVLALDRVLTDDAGHLAAYNVCSGTPVTIGEVAQLVARGRGSDIEPEVTGDYRSGDVRHVVASPERARTDLGFTAEIGPEQGLAEFATAPLRGLSGAVLPGRVEQVLHHQRDRQLEGQQRSAPARGEQRRGDQQPRDERQPDPLHLRAAHL